MTKPTASKTSSSNQPAPQGKRFDETFKLDAVQLRENSGRPRAQVARDLGVSQVTLAAWETRYGSGGGAEPLSSFPAGRRGLPRGMGRGARSSHEGKVLSLA